ncbi:MAG: hemerythrin family protein, partial [Rhodospirillaceae bacterium]|nr:hemerythrin family protein [Rhodospirillaceae bacterium]
DEAAMCSNLYDDGRFWVELPVVSNKNVMVWADNLRIGVDAIDRDHQRIISLSNAISYDPLNEVEFNVIIEELIDYTRYHFDREEAIMKVFGYPDLEKQQSQHQEFISRIKEQESQWNKNRDMNILNNLRPFLRSWLVAHIEKEDAKIAPYTKGKAEEIRVALKRFG